MGTNLHVEGNGKKRLVKPQANLSRSPAATLRSGNDKFQNNYSGLQSVATQCQ
ncbi:MAG: hypothetical protein HY231_15585 [Acidobacteria bacterium]|nr:hypothetical protein [Acidobacteriota bacterium]